MIICIKVRTISADGENLQLWQQKPLFSLITPGVPLHGSPWVVGDLCWKEMWYIAHNRYIECLMELGVGKGTGVLKFSKFFVLHLIFMYKIGITQLTKVGQNL
jgi:hypothetical protein